jgi:ribosomal protein S18 acetylase RimI-like enzyme
LLVRVSRKDGSATSIRLRLARQTDAHQLDLLLFELARFSKGRRIREIRRGIKDREIVVAAAQSPVGSSKPENLVGFVHGIVHNDPISAGPLLYITSLYVKHGFRRQVIGTSLLGFIIHRSVKYRAIEGVEVATARRPALMFYKQLGFSQYKEDFGEKLVQIDSETWRARRVQGLKDD